MAGFGHAGEVAGVGFGSFSGAVVAGVGCAGVPARGTTGLKFPRIETAAVPHAAAVARRGPYPAPVPAGLKSCARPLPLPRRAGGGSRGLCRHPRGECPWPAAAGGVHARIRSCRRGGRVSFGICSGTCVSRLLGVPPPGRCRLEVPTGETAVPHAAAVAPWRAAAGSGGSQTVCKTVAPPSGQEEVHVAYAGAGSSSCYLRGTRHPHCRTGLPLTRQFMAVQQDYPDWVEYVQVSDRVFPCGQCTVPSGTTGVCQTGRRCSGAICARLGILNFRSNRYGRAPGSPELHPEISPGAEPVRLAGLPPAAIPSPSRLSGRGRQRSAACRLDLRPGIPRRPSSSGERSPGSRAFGYDELIRQGATRNTLANYVNLLLRKRWLRGNGQGRSQALSHQACNPHHERRRADLDLFHREKAGRSASATSASSTTYMTFTRAGGDHHLQRTALESGESRTGAKLQYDILPPRSRVYRAQGPQHDRPTELCPMGLEVPGAAERRLKRKLSTALGIRLISAGRGPPSTSGPIAA